MKNFTKIVLTTSILTAFFGLVAQAQNGDYLKQRIPNSENKISMPTPQHIINDKQSEKISQKASKSNNLAMTSCTDKINYVGNNSQYYFQIGSMRPTANFLHYRFLFQTFQNYEGDVLGVEFNAATFGAANKSLVVAIYQINSSGMPFGGWIVSSTVTISGTNSSLYTAMFNSPATIANNDGFAVGLFFGGNSAASDSVKAFVSPQLSLGSTEYAYLMAGNVIKDFPTHYGSGYNANALIRPIVTTSVSSKWLTSRTSTGCALPVEYDFSNNSLQPSFYVSDPLISPGGIKDSIDFGDGSPVINFSHFFTQPHAYSSIGNYIANYTQTYIGWTNNCVESLTLAIDVENPKPSFSFTTNGLSVKFDNTSQNMNNFTWNFGDLITSNLNEPGTHVFSSPGTYIVELEGNATCGKVRYSASVVVVGSTGIKENYLGNSISIFPNPVTNTLKIKNNGIEELDTKIVIYNYLGAIVKTINSLELNSSNSGIDVSELSKGLYFIKVKTKDGELVKSFIKE